MGKTYFAVRDGWLDLMSGRKVVTNFALNVPEAWTWRRQEYRRDELHAVTHVENWEEFSELEDCHAIIDEGHLWAPSYDPKSLPEAARYKLTHLRKFGMTMTFVTQHEDRAARMLRDLCTEIIDMRRWFFPGGPWFTAAHYEPEKIGRKGAEWIYREKFRLSPMIAASYNTLECAGFPTISDPYELGLVTEIARRRNSGEALVGSTLWVREQLAENTPAAQLWRAITAADDKKGSATPRALRSSLALVDPLGDPDVELPPVMGRHAKR